MENKGIDGRIIKVSGPLVVAEGMRNVPMFDVVRVSDLNLIGEVIEVHGDNASIQVYEDTAGLGPGEPVRSTGFPLSVELGPGLIGHIFDGIERPLEKLYESEGTNIPRGVEIDPIDREKKWKFTPKLKESSVVTAGDVVGTVKETSLIEHKIMVPPTFKGRGELSFVAAEGEYTVNDTVFEIAVKTKSGDQSTESFTMMQRWPVRLPRPHAGKIAPSEPLLTGQRIIDSFFPITKGGTAAVPGPFGSGKTVIQHQLAKWAASDIVVYIGCGERGNEMTDVLGEFPALIDPKTGKSIMERTILIANTSDMPVAAREASIYTGITIAEYYRDMGYQVSIMADSTSRWAEALREMSGRLEEMPGEEGYPAYLGSRLAQFYERAGMVTCLGSQRRTGVLTAIGAVSPPGGDMSDPVVQATLRIVKVFWRLDSDLAYKRHFPAINWLSSYSLYQDKVSGWMDEHIYSEWSGLRSGAMNLLKEEAELEEIVKLVGLDTLSLEDRVKLEMARSLREDFLHQNSFDEVDTFTSRQKQLRMLQLIMQYYERALSAVKSGATLNEVLDIKAAEKIGRFKYVKEDEIEDSYKKLRREIDDEIAGNLESGKA